MNSGGIAVHSWPDPSSVEVRYYTRQQLALIYEAIDRIVKTGRAEGTMTTAAGRRGPRLRLGAQFKLLCKLMEWTGARVSEALSLRPADIRWDMGDGGVVGILTLKKRGRRVLRYVPLRKSLRSELLRFMKRHRLGMDSMRRFFGFSRSVVMKYCTRLQRVLGFEVRTHFFRHTFAVRCLVWAKKKVPLNVLQKWLGHSSIVNTSIYTDVGAIDTSEYMRLLR